LEQVYAKINICVECVRSEYGKSKFINGGFGMRGLGMNKEKKVNTKPLNRNMITTRTWKKDLRLNYDIYLLVIPAVVYYIVFHYL
jgi:hypothetical protein